jgi:hypothetical protein
MEQQEQFPRMLPIVEFDCRSWFVDGRLRQFRDVWNPHDYVDFDSGQGKLILHAWLEQVARYDR